MTDSHADDSPEDLAKGNPDSVGEARAAPEPAGAARHDPRSDIEQAVRARSDAVDRGEGGDQPGILAATGDHDGNSGTGGEVRNQDLDQQ